MNSPKKITSANGVPPRRNSMAKYAADSTTAVAAANILPARASDAASMTTSGSASDISQSRSADTAPAFIHSAAPPAASESAADTAASTPEPAASALNSTAASAGSHIHDALAAKPSDADSTAADVPAIGSANTAAMTIRTSRFLLFIALSLKNQTENAASPKRRPINPSTRPANPAARAAGLDFTGCPTCPFRQAAQHMKCDSKGSQTLWRGFSGGSAPERSQTPPHNPLISNQQIPPPPAGFAPGRNG